MIRMNGSVVRPTSADAASWRSQSFLTCYRAAIVSQAQSSTHTHARITQVYYWHASSSPPSTAFRASSVAPGKQ